MYISVSNDIIAFKLEMTNNSMTNVHILNTYILYARIQYLHAMLAMSEHKPIFNEIILTVRKYLRKFIRKCNFVASIFQFKRPTKD